ncbi:MAG: hypothetical protein D6800_06680 [Candidatus Zixiibacteriota bacterium]|nr:MAG: hypothetical protein D6800_06680 [candidate division Zixibacteria bacterium]
MFNTETRQIHTDATVEEALNLLWDAGDCPFGFDTLLESTRHILDVPRRPEHLFKSRATDFLNQRLKILFSGEAPGEKPVWAAGNWKSGRLEGFLLLLGKEHPADEVAYGVLEASWQGLVRFEKLAKPLLQALREIYCEEFTEKLEKKETPSESDDDTASE